MYNTEKFDHMSIDEKYTVFINITTALRKSGVFKKWYELANMLSVSPNSISGAKNKNPDYLTSSLLVKLKDLYEQCVLEKSTMGFADGQIRPMLVPGAMPHKSEYQDSDSGIPVRPGIELKLVPTIPYKTYKDANIDIQKYISDPESKLATSPVVSQFPSTDLHYFVGSDAMSPYLCPSDVLALKRVPCEHIINGEIYVINTKTNGMIERFVYEDGDEFMLKASPGQARYTPMRIRKDEIFNLYRILGLIRTNI